MTRGSQAKAEILTKLQEIYPNAFLVDKVLRVPMIEDGQTVEIKITLVAAKDVLGNSISDVVDLRQKTTLTEKSNISVAESIRPTEEEKKLVAEMVKIINSQ